MTLRRTLTLNGWTHLNGNIDYRNVFWYLFHYSLLTGEHTWMETLTTDVVVKTKNSLLTGEHTWMETFYHLVLKYREGLTLNGWTHLNGNILPFRQRKSRKECPSLLTGEHTWMETSCEKCLYINGYRLTLNGWTHLNGNDESPARAWIFRLTLNGWIHLNGNLHLHLDREDFHAHS